MSFGFSPTNTLPFRTALPWPHAHHAHHAHASDHGRFRGFSEATYGLFTGTSLKIPWISDAPFQRKIVGRINVISPLVICSYSRPTESLVSSLPTPGLTGDLVISSVCRTATRQVTRKVIASSLAWSGPVNQYITKSVSFHLDRLRDFLSRI